MRSSVAQIIRFGRVVRPIMGISFAPDQSVEQLGVTGVLVLDAREGGPAYKAGIQGTSRDEYGRLVLGDIIVAIDGKSVKNAGDLYRQLDKKEVGDQLDVEVRRAGIGGRVGGWVGGWLGGWMGGWVGGWVGVRERESVRASWDL